MSQTAALRALSYTFALLEGSSFSRRALFFKSKSEGVSGTVIIYRGHITRPSLYQLSSTRQNSRSLFASLMRFEWQLWGEKINDLSFQKSLSLHVATCSYLAPRKQPCHQSSCGGHSCGLWSSDAWCKKWVCDQIFENLKKKI